ncbi:hypothetical protein ABTD92_19990, partial [Acinetobacter baumannii]
PELLEQLLRGAEVDESDKLGAVRVAWCRELSQTSLAGDLGKILLLVDIAEQAHVLGAKDLAINLLWRAAQRCWWSNADADVCARILAAADRLG